MRCCVGGQHNELHLFITIAVAVAVAVAVVIAVDCLVIL